MAIALTTTIIFSAIIIMLFSSATTTQTNNDIGGKPERTHFIVEACKNASINSSEYNHITEEFCVSTLRQDKQSDEAKDLRDLVLIGVDILKGHIIAASGQEALYKQNIELGDLGSLNVALVAPYWDLTQN
ncbi:unnamed protein product [Triticum turgidum subsp. durum]|uniref:Pectinesterase inhibitor domain-containing protein n=1 Tax=Triticum turgidum subsp. durum TaxID=4567 RepID=A0A9R0V1U2_TRITD|nr:unnamed protein product [Triticum turgidum subsp. durum]